MKLLLKREQASDLFARPRFQLWGKIELDDLEAEAVRKYRFDDKMLIEADQPELIRRAAFVAVGAAIAAYPILWLIGMGVSSLWVALLLGVGGGYFYFHQKRETIYVKDLIHGRYFTCDSVVDLARKEAWLQTIVGFLRQVMESAKHWDGTETIDVPVLDRDAAKELIIRGL